LKKATSTEEHLSSYKIKHELSAWKGELFSSENDHFWEVLLIEQARTLAKPAQ